MRTDRANSRSAPYASRVCCVVEAAAIAALERLAALGLELPPAMRIPGQKFETVQVSGNRITIAGHLPFDVDGKLAKPLGKVGAEVDADEAHEAARQVALGMLASLQAAGVDLDRVEWRKAFGMVNAAPGFNALPGVINGFSELLLEVFGERGRHSRSAIGVAELPFGAPVEVEAEAVLLPAKQALAEPAPSDAMPASDTPPPTTLQDASARDPGLRLTDYAGISPLSIPAEALVRSIESLSNLFWISLGGTVVTVFLAALVNLVGAGGGALPVGEFDVPLSVLPIACLAFAMFMFWLIASRLKMLLAALADDDLTAAMARDIFRLDPPVLDVFAADNLRYFAPLSGFSVLLWNWSMFFGSSVGLIFTATLLQGMAASVDTQPELIAYAIATLAIIAYGLMRVLPPLRQIHERLHGKRLRVGLVRMATAAVVAGVGVLATNSEFFEVMDRERWEPLGPVRANAIDGETLMLEGGKVIMLAGIKALSPDQTCTDADGTVYPCGQEATLHLQSLVRDKPVFCLVSYPNLGLCTIIEDGVAVPKTERELFTETNLAYLMVVAGYALAEGDAIWLLIDTQNDAQRNRRGAWRGAFEPPGHTRTPLRAEP